MAILDFLIPDRCHLCGSQLPEGVRGLCPLCAAGLERTGFHLKADNAMTMRLAGRVKFVRAAGHFYYTPDSPLAMLIHDFKYRGRPSLARRLGEIAGNELQGDGFLTDIDLLMPVPLHWLKRMRRGYNQAEEIALGIARSSGLRVSTDLKATRGHRSQTRMTHEERQHNTEGIFRLRHAERYAGLHIALIDDVCTTGSTLASAAQALLDAAPGARVSLPSLAVTIA